MLAASRELGIKADSQPSFFWEWDVWCLSTGPGLPLPAILGFVAVVGIGNADKLHVEKFLGERRENENTHTPPSTKSYSQAAWTVVLTEAETDTLPRLTNGSPSGNSSWSMVRIHLPKQCTGLGLQGSSPRATVPACGTRYTSITQAILAWILWPLSLSIFLWPPLQYLWSTCRLLLQHA